MTTRTLRTLAELRDAGLPVDADDARLRAVADRYAVAVTPAVARLIEPGDPADPIARQYLPSVQELDILPSELADPIGDDAHSPVTGIVHRYPDRVLLKPVHVCPVYCRFCFRREMVGPGGRPALTPSELDAALAYIAADPGIWEVIVTGGDPLILSPRRIRALVDRLSAIPHVAVVRWHSRVPVAAPETVTPALVKALRAFRGASFVAIHANHPRELTPEALAAIRLLADAGVPLLSQTVLLKGVNDDVETLAALMRGFVAARVRPYYLHQADMAPGTAHFRVSLAEGRALVEALRGRLSGLCQPTYVLDIPGGFGKSPIGPDYVSGEHVRDYRGREHAYPPE